VRPTYEGGGAAGLDPHFAFARETANKTFTGEKAFYQTLPFTFDFHIITAGNKCRILQIDGFTIKVLMVQFTRHARCNTDLTFTTFGGELINKDILTCD
jgi:hypothetical protein